MDCLTGGVHPSRKAVVYSAAELKPALVDFFQIPEDLWPPGLALVSKAQQLHAQQDDNHRLACNVEAREVMSTCVQVSHDLCPGAAPVHVDAPFARLERVAEITRDA